MVGWCGRGHPHMGYLGTKVDHCHFVRAAWALARVSLVTALHACGGPTQPPQPSPPPPAPVASISLTPDSTSLPIGGTVQLTAVVRDAAGTALVGRAITWSSSNGAIASVSSAGVVTAVVVGGPVRITATSETKTAVSTIVVNPAPTGIVGPEGGMVMAPSGGTIAFSPGAVAGPVLVQVSDTQSVEPRYTPLSIHSIRLIVPIVTSNFQQNGVVKVSIPTSRPLQAGTSGYVRARLRGIPGELWAPATPTQDGRLSFSIPSEGFPEFKTVLGIDTLDVVFDAEELARPSPASIRSAAASRSTATAAEACPSPPSDPDPLRYASCAQGSLSQIQGHSGSGGIGVVLIHGWDLAIASWQDFYLAQGLRCGGSLLPGPWTCSPDPSLQVSLPGQVYFSSLVTALKADGAFRGVPLYVFTYQSYRHVLTSAQDLINSLAAEQARSGVARFVLVGHSMGGLVGRTAARLLESSGGDAQTILGIITLATPHNGTPLPATLIAKALSSGIRTDGGQDLINPLPRDDRAPLRMFGGRFLTSASVSTLYLLPYQFLCQVSVRDCDNDGIVPTYSSLPSFVPAGIGSIHSPNDRYDHGDMKGAVQGGSADPLYVSISAELQELLSRAGADAISFQQRPAAATVGAVLTPALTVALEDGMGHVMKPPPNGTNYSVTIRLSTNPGAGATLGGTTTVSTVNGIATFADLTLDRPGPGYVLEARAVGLSVTSGAFTVSPAPLPPSIQLSPVAVSFAATAGGTAPPAQSIGIDNGGGGSLSGLTRGPVTYATGEPSGWLATPSLSATTAPATLTLRPSTTSLAAGTYHTTVAIGAAGNVRSAAVNVTYMVAAVPLLSAPALTAPPNSAIGVSTGPTFSWNPVQGANRYWLTIATNANALPTDPAAVVCPGCVISGTTNATGHTLPNAFPIAGTSALLAAGTTYYWRVQGWNTSGAQGQYSTIAGFTTVGSAVQGPAIALSSNVVPFTFTVGGASPVSRVVGITNVGTGSLSGLSIGSVAYTPGEPTSWLTPTLSGTTAPTSISFAVSPSGLSPGTYSATIGVGSNSPGVTNSPQVVTITIAVSPAAPAIAMDRATVPFTFTIGGAVPGLQVVNITNGGTGTLSGLTIAPVAYAQGQPTGWLSAALTSTTVPTSISFVVLPSTLTAGTYSGSVAVHSNTPGVTNSPQSVTITLKVAAAPRLPPPTITGPGSTAAPGPLLSTLTPTFSWNAVTRATGYGLYIRDLTTNQLVYPNAAGTTTAPLSGTSFALPAGVIPASHDYRWAMTSFNGATESSTQSSVLYFQTTAPPPLAPPTITGPGTTTAPGPVLSTLTPTFTWNAVTGATGYGLYIRDLTTNQLVYPNAAGTTTAPLSGTSFALPAGFITASHDYRWAMTSFNGPTESSTQSSVLFFQTAAPPPLAPPTITGPGTTTAPGPVLSTLTPTFSWGAVTRATGYNLYIRDIATAGLITVPGVQGTSYSLAPGFLANNHQYRWAMTSLNGSTESTSQSNTLYFSTPLTPGPFSLEVRYLAGGSSQAPTTSQRKAFDNVVARIQQIITRKVGTVPVVAAAGSCGPTSPSINETIDDLLVFVSLEPIDGGGSGGLNVLGQGGGCLVRAGSFQPIVGSVTLDAADLPWLEAGGQLESVILHEMMHALGFGTVWGPAFNNLLVNPSKPASPGVDTYFVGTNTVAGFDEIGGITYTGGRKAPVEITALLHADTHWRASVLINELMQPFIVAGRPSPLSRLTLRSLQDLGYSVDLNQADPFSIMPSLARGAPSATSAGAASDDIARYPVKVVDGRGRIIRVIRR